MPKLGTFDFTVGSFLIVASIFSILRQTDRMSLDIEVPSLFIALGLIMIAAQAMNLPKSTLLNLDTKPND